jgi:hypothetical protein
MDYGLEAENFVPIALHGRDEPRSPSPSKCQATELEQMLWTGWRLTSPFFSSGEKFRTEDWV